MKKARANENGNSPKVKQQVGATKPLFPLATDSEVVASRGIPTDLEETFFDLIRLGAEWKSIDSSSGMVDKDRLARRAIGLAGQLIGPLITWAINHEAGKALVGLRSYVSYAPHRRKTQKAAALTDEHTATKPYTERAIKNPIIHAPLDVGGAANPLAAFAPQYRSLRCFALNEIDTAAY